MNVLNRISYNEKQTCKHYIGDRQGFPHKSVKRPIGIGHELFTKTRNIP